MADDTPKKDEPHEMVPAEEVPRELPILPLRNSVFFPGGVLPLAVGRKKTIALIKEAVKDDSLIGVVSQRRAEDEDPEQNDLYGMGTVARIVKLLKMGEDNYSLVVQGLARFRMQEITQIDPFLRAKIEPVDMPAEVEDVEVQALAINLKKLASEVIDMMPELPPAATELIESITHPGHLADLITANIDVPIEDKQSVLETVDLKARLKLTMELLNRKREVLKLSNKIETQVKGEMSKTQREYYLRQQLKAIKEELGELGEDEEEVDELQERLRKAGLPAEVEKVAMKELNRLKNIPTASSEYTVARTYLEWIADLPWKKATEDNLDIENASQVLDEDHYGLEKVKKRILEYLAVRKLKKDMRGPILCLVGPPGVGKTSLGQAIADSLGRKFVRMSLGGVRDEAEIRGHRRTYVGALPGRIIQGMKKAGTINPLMMLDEVDKLGMDFRGDPSSALLEVLDPEQNNSFSDHYLDVAYDLSKVMFICTANLLDPIPAALKDRMEVIELPGYTFDEKEQIAIKHLIPKQIEEHGLTKEHVEVSPESLHKIIIDYTREAGVRNLERRLADVCRAIAVKVASAPEGKIDKITVGDEDLHEFLGPQKFFSEVAERTELAGVATGLAWTAAGGEILFIEVTKMPGKGQLVLTGQLGEVMKESAQAALSYVRSRADQLGIEANFLEKTDVHIHFPAGAIPKDGPSAGVTVFTALASLLTGIPCKGDVAMTGECTLRGLVLPVGGIKEKVLAAHRAGIKKCILPERNKKDLEEVPDQARKEMDFVFAAHMDDVLEHALERRVSGKKSGGGTGGKKSEKKTKDRDGETEVRAGS